MESYFDILRACPLFHEISVQDLSSVLSCLGAKVSSFHKKETILSEGEPARYVGIVLSGHVQIIRDDYFGNRNIVAGLGPSELFGESFACAEVLAVPVSVIASEAVEVMLIDCMKITHSCSSACGFHQQLIINLLKVMAGKNLAFHQKLAITSKRTTREKLLAYLMLEAQKNRSNSFQIPYSRQELADYLEVDRSGLSVIIRKLAGEGVIQVNQRWFKLLPSPSSPEISPDHSWW